MPVARLFVIDAHALCYRAFYAIKGLARDRAGHQRRLRFREYPAQDFTGAETGLSGDLF